MVSSLLLVAALAQPALAQPAPPLQGLDRTWALDSTEDLKDWALDATGEAKKRMGAPKIEGKKLTLLESWWRSTAAAAPPFISTQLTRSFEVEFTFSVNTGTEGFGLAWVDITKHGESGIPAPMTAEESRDPGGNAPAVELPAWGWEEPSLRRAFGVGFDASNPPNRDPFKGSGNVYDRPQHEVSLHWDGLEIIKRTTPAEFRDEKPHKVKVRAEFVTGGAEVTLLLDDQPMWDRYFVPGMTPFAGRPVFGARNSDTAGDVTIDDVRVKTDEPIAAPVAPLSVAALERVLNDAAHPENAATVEFPALADMPRYGRIIATLRLEKPATRFDPWDRTAHIFIERPVPATAGPDAKPERIELFRYITPYHRGFEWQVDVSDFRPLLSGTQRIIQVCGTQGEGWVVSLKFDFYPGPAPGGQHAREVVTLWSGDPSIGNPDAPPSAFYQPRDVALPEWVSAARVRMVVTGHGMSPNSGNAAEFMSIDRTLTINGLKHTHTLWKTDNYLNPCRPQGGTWKYDRAGWAPGDVVAPWLVNVPLPATESSAAVPAQRQIRIAYELAPYINENRGKTWAPSHRTESQLILYERVR